MNIKMTIKDVCANIPQVELEENVDINDIEKVLDTVKKIAADLADGRGPYATPIHSRPVTESNQSPATPRAELPPVQPPCDFTPITVGQRHALETIAAKDRKSLTQFCHDCGVDIETLSKAECRSLLQNLNDKSGFSKIQQSRQQYNRFPRADRYPDDSDVFGK